MAIPDDAPDLVETVDGVQLQKSLDEDAYDIPTLVYEIESRHEDPVEVTIREEIPDSVSVEDVGFHRQKGAEYWDVDEGELVFEYTLSPDEAFTTIYAIRAGTTVHTDDLVTSPNVVDVEPVSDAVPEPTQMTRSGAESPYQTESQDAGADAKAAETGPAGGVDLDGPLPEEGEGVEATDELLADRLAEEIRAGEVSADSLDVLQDTLLNEAIAGGAVDARLTQLQQDVGDLRAYKNALEAFLEDEGSAQEIIDSFEERLEAVESEVSSLRSAVDSIESRSDSHESDIRAMDTEIDEISSEHEDLVVEFESLAEDVNAMDDRVPEYQIDDRMDELETQIESVGEFVDNLKTAFE